ncbi:MAG: DUF3822 family protein [Flavobacteriales bacterium]
MVTGANNTKENPFKKGDLTVLPNNAVLSIVISENFLVASLFDNDSTEIKAVRKYELDTPQESKNIAGALSKEMPKLPEKVVLIFMNDHYSVIPAPIYDSSMEKDYFKITHDNLPNNVEITRNQMRELNSINVFAYKKDFSKDILKYFPNAKIYHHTTILIEAFIRLNDQNKGNVFAYCRKDRLDLAFFDNNRKKMLLFNSYFISSAQDLIYYIIYSAEQLNIDMKDTELSIAGKVFKKEDTIRFLKQYIYDVKEIESESFN